MPSSTPHKRRWRWIVVGLVLLLIGARLALPWFLTRKLNETLADKGDYTGHVEDVDLALIAGTFWVDGIVVRLKEQPDAEPLVTIQTFKASIDWRAILDWHLVAVITFVQPRVTFIAETKQQPDDLPKSDFRDQIRETVPIRIDRVVVEDGFVHYIAPGSRPPVDVQATGVQLEARNLTNSLEISESLAATFHGSATVMGSGAVKADGRIDPYAEAPTFDLNASMEGLDLTTLNPFLKRFARVDVKAGRLAVYTEIAADQGKVTGYIKPLAQGLDVLDLKGQDKEDGPLRKAWEALVGAVAELFENQQKDQQGTRIPIRHTLKDPTIGVWPAIGQALKNAFIRALSHSLEGSVRLGAGDGEKEGDEG